jgi:hypothetical protein
MSRKTGSIPWEWDSPIASPTIIYWRGLDHLALHWTRTQSLAADEHNIESLHEYLFWRKNLVIWACCAVESFVNEEGVAWLGEAFFRANLERLGICQKIAVLYALKYDRRLTESDEALNEVNKLFQLRNRLVHPKTRKVRQDRETEETLRTDLDNVSPDSLRRVFWRVTALFEKQPRRPKTAKRQTQIRRTMKKRAKRRLS